MKNYGGAAAAWWASGLFLGFALGVYLRGAAVERQRASWAAIEAQTRDLSVKVHALAASNERLGQGWKACEIEREASYRDHMATIRHFSDLEARRVTCGADPVGQPIPCPALDGGLVTNPVVVP